MEQVIRAALIGFGDMGRLYAMMLQAGLVPGMQLTGVCCRSELGLSILKEKFPGVRVYADAEEMAHCSEEYDAAIIVTPHPSHVQIAKLLVSEGKHILMDKPAGVFADEVRQLEQLCREKNVAFGMIFNNRQLSCFREAKRLLHAGALGTLHRAVWVCNSWYRSPAYHRSAAWRSSWLTECGGMMTNQNPHYLDMWNWFFGMPDGVYASLDFGKYNAFLVDDGCDIQFYYDSGFHGTFISATGEAPGVNRLEIWGSKGKLTLEDGKLSLDENQPSTEEFGKINQEKFAVIPHTLRQIPLEPVENPYQPVLANFAAHLREGVPLAADGLDGWREVALANAIYVSAWEEKKLRLPADPECFRKGLALRQQEERTGHL